MQKLILIFVAASALVAFAVLIGPHILEATRTGETVCEREREEESDERPNDWFMMQRIWPGSELNRAAAEEARGQSLRLHRMRRPLDNEQWSFAGPSNVGGRVTALAVHPSAVDTVYAGAADGGVFKSTDGGHHFSAVFDYDFALSTGALAVDPSNPQRVWFGSGEANGSRSSYGGNGIYLSENGGRTWVHKGLDSTRSIGRIVVDPTDPNRVFVAAAGELYGANPQRGLYRTTNLGTTWQRVLFLTDSTACIDVALNPQQPDTLFAVMWERVRRPWGMQAAGITSGIWRSYDGGDTWSELITGLPHTTSVGRGGIAIAPSNPNQLYASYANHPGSLLGIYRSTNGGDTWQTTSAPSGSFYSTYGWYFGQILVHPTNANTFYVQGIDMFRSTNAGSSWTRIFGAAHVDHHAFWVDPNTPTHMITGHDAGVDISTNSGSTSTHCDSLPSSQFYAITVDPTLPYRLYGGTQDNSTPRTLTGGTDDWDILYGGDGFYCLVDPRNSNVIYAEYQYGGLGKSTNGGSSWSYINSAFSSDRCNWCTPYAMNPRNPDELYLGSHRVWRTTNGGSSWTAISSDLTDGPGQGTQNFGSITTLAVSPVDTSVIYVGTDDANVWVSTNRGALWTNITSGVPQRWVTRVAPHPDSASVAYLSVSGYRELDYLPHLLRSSNYGATWTDVGMGLPECPVNDIIVDPTQPSHLYVATDFGVFYTPDYTEHWYPLGNNLPSCAVLDLHFVAATRTLIAGTHGRSMWKISLGSALAGAPRNLVISLEGDQAVLHWSRAGGETSFTIYGSTDSSLPGDSLTTVTDTTWTDTQFTTRPAPFFYYARGRSDAAR